MFWADPSGAATGFAGAVEQHANGLGASEMGMDNEKWEHEEGDTYRNNSTSETTTNSKKATGETLGAFQSEAYSVHAFDKEGEAYKFQKEKSESGKEVVSLVTDANVFVLPWAGNSLKKSFSQTPKNSLGHYDDGKKLFVQFIGELAALGKIDVYAQVHTHPDHSSSDDDDRDAAKNLRVPVYNIGSSAVGYYYNFENAIERVKGRRNLTGTNSGWASPGEVFTGKKSIRNHALSILKQNGLR